MTSWVKDLCVCRQCGDAAICLRIGIEGERERERGRERERERARGHAFVCGTAYAPSEVPLSGCGGGKQPLRRKSASSLNRTRQM